MGRLVKLKMEEIGFAPAHPRVTPIALVLLRSKETGSPILTVPITFHAASGVAKVVSR
jgi:hypothetical protein